jgi:hypothetical protein
MTETSLECQAVYSFPLEEIWSAQDLTKTGKRKCSTTAEIHEVLNLTMLSAIAAIKKYELTFFGRALGGILIGRRLSFWAQAMPPMSSEAMTAMVTITTVSSSVIFQCTLDLLDR